MKFLVSAVRTYYTAIAFQVEADNNDAAVKKARQMIEDHEVEYDALDAAYEDDLISVYPEH